MSILIEGMEIPKDCIKCRFCLFTGGYWKCLVGLVDGSHADFGGTCRPSECPLVDVPEPHGRLIDASEAYDKIAEQEGGNYVDMDAVGMGLDETPTVIPASEV